MEWGGKSFEATKSSIPSMCKADAKPRSSARPFCGHARSRARRKEMSLERHAVLLPETSSPSCTSTLSVGVKSMKLLLAAGGQHSSSSN